MGIIDWIVQRVLRGVAHRLAQKAAKLYRESKARNPDASEAKVIRAMAFDEEELAGIPPKTKRRIEICCETVQGFCYMMGLDAGRIKGWKNPRPLQFTYYIDRALEARGFPPQSKEQKERVLGALGLNIPGWDKITVD